MPSVQTTIMAVTFDGGVILGADSRTSTGSYVANRVSDKITAIHDRIYVCRSGSAADTQALADYVRRFAAEHSLEKGGLPSVQSVSKLFRTLCYQNKDRLMAGVIVAGWDPTEGGSVYEIALGGSCVKQHFSIGGSGSTFIYGLVDSLFRPGMSKEECKKFVATSISHAMARDGSSGGVIRMVIIDKDGVTREFIPGDKLPFMLGEATSAMAAATLPGFAAGAAAAPAVAAPVAGGAAAGMGSA